MRDVRWETNGVVCVGRTTVRAIYLETFQGRCVSGRPGPGPGPGIGPLARANLVWDASERARWAAAAARITRLFTHTPDADFDLKHATGAIVDVEFAGVAMQ